MTEITRLEPSGESPLRDLCEASDKAVELLHEWWKFEVIPETYKVWTCSVGSLNEIFSVIGPSRDIDLLDLFVLHLLHKLGADVETVEEDTVEEDTVGQNDSKQEEKESQSDQA